mgnify:CR=1 FL=1
MKKRNLKRIIQELKSLLNELESEVYSDTEAYVHPWYEKAGKGAHRIDSGDDDGYAD